MSMNILVTGGTVFASRYTAKYFSDRGNNVYVLNRNTRPQLENVTLINCDRHCLGNTLRRYSFDAIIDVTAYNEKDVRCLTEALGEFDRYIMISSSAVYPETLAQPFSETQKCGLNSYWGDYGTNKIAAEKILVEKVPDAYIIRPPYLYGEMNNLYREAFVFDCAENDRPFFVPKHGKMQLQFLDIEDMCRFIEIILEKKPERHIFNVGNPNTVDICQWAELCYKVLGKEPQFDFVVGDIPQRSYFPFLDYEYVLDVKEQSKLMPDVKSMEQGLHESYEWYKNNRDKVRRKPLIEFIDEHLL